MPPGFNHGAAWLLAAASLGGLLVLQAVHGHADHSRDRSDPTPAACAPAPDDRLDRHEFEEQLPDDTPGARVDPAATCGNEES